MQYRSTLPVHLRASALVAAFAVSIGANAAIVTQNGTSVSFTYDDATLYGAGTVVGDAIFFNPTEARIESLDDEGLASLQLALDIQIDSLSPTSVTLEQVATAESGDYIVDGAGASAEVNGSLSVSSLTSSNTASSSFTSGVLTSGTDIWEADTSIDISSWTDETSVLVALDNTLTATSTVQGERAFVQKKFSSTAVGVIVNPVPVPAAFWMFGSALLGLGAMRRNK